MDPLLIVIISFGLIFVVTASLGNGLSITLESVRGPLQAHKQLNVMLVIEQTSIVLPVFYRTGSHAPSLERQSQDGDYCFRLERGAPFIPWLVSLAKGDLAYSSSAVILVTLGTFVVLRLALPATS